MIEEPITLDDFHEALARVETDLIEGDPLLAITADGRFLALIGRHAESALCWCMPRCEWYRCVAGHTHATVFHKRVMDAGDQEGVGTPGWDVEADGSVYPSGQARAS